MGRGRDLGRVNKAYPSMDGGELHKAEEAEAVLS
jgi:hypothetical protein